MATLFRQEFELKKGINWGQRYFDSVNNPSRIDHVLAPRPRVQYMLEHAVETEFGPIDATSIIKQLTEDEQCDFFSRVPKCQILILRSWTHLSDKVLRGISFSMGVSLTDVDFSDSMISAPELEILLYNASSIRIFKLERCVRLDAKCMGVLTRICQRSLKELYLSDSPLIKEDPLLWMCGCVGISSPRLSSLRVLDLSLCPLVDAGLRPIAGTCKQLRFLNLNECTLITDAAFIEVALSCHHLELVNVAGCLALTNKSIIALAKNCANLSSLNLSKVCEVSDPAVTALGKHCPKLQALNLAGAVRITEVSLCHLAQGCPGLLMLNVTGCDRVTVNGLKTLVHGLGYVEVALSYVGLKPTDGHIEKKLIASLDMIRESAAGKITRGFGAVNRKLKVKAEYKETQIDAAAKLIQGSMFRYKCRLHYYYIYMEKKKVSSAITLQRVSRGRAARFRVAKLRAREDFFRSHAPYALVMQRVFRAHKVRKANVRLARVLREMYIVRKEEAQFALVVRLQSMGRRFLATGRTLVLNELSKRRNIDEDAAALTMQGLARIFLGKMLVGKMKSDASRVGELRDIAAQRIQAFYRSTQGKLRMKQSKFERDMAMRARAKASRFVQRFSRGFLARQRVARLRIKLAERWFSAICIQRIYRGTRIMQWRDVRLNIICAYVLDRQYLERRERVHASRARYKIYVEENHRDSASDEEPPEVVIGWVKMHDKVKRRPYWFSEMLNQITYDEPADPIAMAKGMVGLRIRVYWVAQLAWYEGVIGRYHRRKKRHRVNYDDGDHEWLNLEEERNRIQVQQADGSWVLYVLYRPPELQDEWRKSEQARANEDFKKQAYADAMQWQPLRSDKTVNEALMFVSDISGEVRAGNEGSEQWVIQDDGHGFPCFYNVETEETKHDDPRFIEDIAEDVAKQKAWVLQELRIAVYFCSDYWERYSQAKDAKRAMHVAMQARNSSKPKHLVAFLIRAKALFQQTSVVDKPIDAKLRQELDYASWLAGEIAKVVQLAEDKVVVQRDAQAGHVSKLLQKSKGKVYCSNCKRETKKHFDYCQICGKRQLFLLDHVDEPPDTGEALTKAQLHAIEFGGPADVDMVDDAGSGGEAEGGSDGEEREENIDSEEEK